MGLWPTHRDENRRGTECSERAQVVQNENSELKVATAHPPLKCRYRRNHNASFTKTTGIG